MHVNEWLNQLIEDDVQIPFGAGDLPVCEMKLLKVMGITVYRWLDGVFMRPKTLDKNQSFIHILAEWTKEDQLTQNNKTLEKDNADESEFAADLDPEKVNLAEAPKSLVSFTESQAASQNNCSQMELDHETSV